MLSVDYFCDYSYKINNPSPSKNSLCLDSPKVQCLHEKWSNKNNTTIAMLLLNTETNIQRLQNIPDAKNLPTCKVKNTKKFFNSIRFHFSYLWVDIFYLQIFSLFKFIYNYNLKMLGLLKCLKFTVNKNNST